jgi:hypothetical protein
VESAVDITVTPIGHEWLAFAAYDLA